VEGASLRTDSMSSLSCRITSSSCFLRLMLLDTTEEEGLLAWLGTWLRPPSELMSIS